MPLASIASALPTAPAPETDVLRQRFQESIAGTFYRTMIKSMRSGIEKSPYFHGGQGEEIFQSQMDDQLSETMAKGPQGEAVTDQLYDSWLQNSGRRLSVDKLSDIQAINDQSQSEAFSKGVGRVLNVLG